VVRELIMAEVQAIQAQFGMLDRDRERDRQRERETTQTHTHTHVQRIS